MELLLVFYGALVVAAVLLPLLFLKRRFILKRKIDCPVKKRPVGLAVLCKRVGNRIRPIKIKACSAFPDPKAVHCDQDCVKRPGSARDLEKSLNPQPRFRTRS